MDKRLEIKTDLTPMINAFKKVAEVPMYKFDGIGWGTIKSISPLTLTIEGHDVPEKFIELSPFCIKWETEIFKHTHKYSDHDKDACGGERATAHDRSVENIDTSEELKKVLMWRGLEAGDEVCVLRTSSSQKFVILWRKNMWGI